MHSDSSRLSQRDKMYCQAVPSCKSYVPENDIEAKKIYCTIAMGYSQPTSWYRGITDTGDCDDNENENTYNYIGCSGEQVSGSFPSLLELVCSCHHTSIAISDNTSPYGNHCHLATLVTTVCWARTRVSFARESRAVSALTLCSAASRLKYQASRQPNTNPIMRRCHDTSFLPADTGPHSALGIVLQLM